MAIFRKGPLVGKVIRILEQLGQVTRRSSASRDCCLKGSALTMKEVMGETRPLVRKVDQSDPLVRNFVSLARRPRNAAPV